MLELLRGLGVGGFKLGLRLGISKKDFVCLKDCRLRRSRCLVGFGGGRWSWRRGCGVGEYG